MIQLIFEKLSKFNLLRIYYYVDIYDNLDIMYFLKK